MNERRSSFGDDPSTTFELTPMPMVACHADGTIRSANLAAAQLLGRSAGELAGHRLTAVVDVHDRMGEAADRAELIAGARAAYVAIASTGDDDPEEVRLVVTGVRDGHGAVTGLLAQIERTGPTDLQPSVEHVARLREQVLHDPLTGLPSRQLLMDRIRAAARRADRHSRPFACLFVDLDRFKSVNDTFGHAVGDRVLVEVADRARRRLRSQDTLSRLGGDEFVVVIEELDRGQGTEVVADFCDSFLALLREPVVIDQTTVEVSASIGAVVSAGAESAEALLHAADVAMYQAKASGRNCWRMHDPTMSTPGRVRHAVHELIRTAMAADRVDVLHQPIIDLRDGSSVGVEAFARIRHEDGSVADPRVFIPVAETTGMIHQLGQQVLRIATASAERAGHGWLAVNVSPRQLAEQGFERLVVEVLDANGIDPGRIVFDITESDHLELDDRHSVSNLRRLHERGIRFALDDFGRGFSSLHRFRHLPVSFIKLDQTFVNGVANIGSGDLAVVRAVLGMAESMGVPVIAEGVETALQHRILRQVGVPLAQGYLFARPSPPVPT